MLHPLPSSEPAPTQLNNPFDYEPHPLVRRAAEEVMGYVRRHAEWEAEVEGGKTLGVLIVQPDDGDIAFIAAFSGLLGGQSQSDYFVPPIYDLLTPGGYFQREQARISSLTARPALSGSPDRGQEGGADSRQEGRRDASAPTPSHRERGLGGEASAALQDWLFHQYQCLNAMGERADIMDIFLRYYRATTLRPEHLARNAASHHIPSGTGDCCAPKLLHYAFAHGLRPLAIGEWVCHGGRIHFRPACQGRCRPLLWFMLQGVPLQSGPRERRAQEALSRTRILYEDEFMVALDKPAGVLSVPGRSSEPSVMDWLKGQGVPVYFPAHRLDQDTSGILLVAKTEGAYRNLQAQFIQHRVRKTYLAVLEGSVGRAGGTLSLPLRSDPLNRPRQLVDRAHGKPALTRYRLLAQREGEALVELCPETGRTHQLRVHCAHPDGLGCPIKGDRLYGHADGGSGRLYLHAAAIRFAHPVTGEPLALSSDPMWSSA